MNLIKDVWLPVIRKNGIKEKIAIHQLLGHYTNPVVELESPRPDFKNSLYQLLVGIIQVSSTPEDEIEWKNLFLKPYNSKEFSERILKYENCFEIDSDGPAFMQDFDLPEGEEKSISALLVESPGAQTIRNNQDHFIKRGLVEKVDGYWAAIALYTLQTFASSGGAGHRVGLRGGGPLTTMILPKGKSTLWEKLWCNIISKEHLPKDNSHNDIDDIFPWMKPTKLSNKGSGIFSNEVHPFHQFFGMPRRMRLSFSKEPGTCDLTGQSSNCLSSHYITKNYGNNYSGAWLHPLNAYTHNPKKPEEPLSIKAQPGGVKYRHWRGLVVESERSTPATVVKLFNKSKYRKDALKQGFILWAAGFDMDNMKVRCWYESTMPLYPLDVKESLKVSKFIGEIIKNAEEISYALRNAIKSAWFNYTKDIRGDTSFLDSSFWQNTESSFYNILDQFINNLDDTKIKSSLRDKWGYALVKEAESCFDTMALTQQDANIKRVFKAHMKLEKEINKMLRDLAKNKAGG